MYFRLLGLVSRDKTRKKKFGTQWCGLDQVLAVISTEGEGSKRDDSILTMSQYTSEYLQEKLQKEFNPIHLVRENVLPSL